MGEGGRQRVRADSFASIKFTTRTRPLIAPPLRRRRDRCSRHALVRKATHRHTLAHARRHAHAHAHARARTHERAITRTRTLVWVFARRQPALARRAPCVSTQRTPAEHSGYEGANEIPYRISSARGNNGTGFVKLNWYRYGGARMGYPRSTYARGAAVGRGPPIGSTIWRGVRHSARPNAAVTLTGSQTNAHTPTHSE